MRDDDGKPLPVGITGRQAMFDAAPELQRRGDWLCLNIECTGAWPTGPQSLIFCEQRIWIIPITSESYPGVAINIAGGFCRDSAERLLYKFLSVLAWREEFGVTVVYRSGGSLPSMIGINKKHGFSIRSLFDFTEIECPVEEDAQIALALVREGRGLNHIAYAFLSFWRVLEIAYPDSKRRVEWMTATLAGLSGHDVTKALEGITSAGIKDVGGHLFKSGRCAVAHATGKPIINPDDPRDARRLYGELPLVREMALKAVEDKFGILRPSTEYSNHLYELRGWKSVLGSDLVERLLTGEWDGEDVSVDLPDIHVRLRGNSPYASFENLIGAEAAVADGMIQLVYISPDGLFRVRFVLILKEERLSFDWDRDLFLHDDGSVEAAKHIKEIKRFTRDYLLNGEMQMLNSNTGSLLSRKDAFMPINFFVDIDVFNSRLKDAQAEIDRRIAERAQASQP